VGISGIWKVDSFSKAIVTSALGAMLAVTSLHLFNGLAWIYGEYTRGILKVQ
jgi:hypothetical protein